MLESQWHTVLSVLRPFVWPVLKLFIKGCRALFTRFPLWSRLWKTCHPESAGYTSLHFFVVFERSITPVQAQTHSNCSYACIRNDRRVDGVQAVLCVSCPHVQQTMLIWPLKSNTNGEVKLPEHRVHITVSSNTAECEEWEWVCGNAETRPVRWR